MSELREEATSFEIEVDGLGTFTITRRGTGLAELTSGEDLEGWWVYNTCGLRLVKFTTRDEARRAINRVIPRVFEAKAIREALRLAESELDSLWCEGAIWK